MGRGNAAGTRGVNFAGEASIAPEIQRAKNDTACHSHSHRGNLGMPVKSAVYRASSAPRLPVPRKRRGRPQAQTNYLVDRQAGVLPAATSVTPVSARHLDRGGMVGRRHEAKLTDK